LRAGTSGDSGVLVYSCAFYQYQVHARLRVQRAPGVPHALFGRVIYQRLGRMARRGRERMSGIDVIASDQLGCEFAQRTATDIRRYDRYINPARHHVRAFAVGWDLRMTGSTRSSSGLDDRRKRLLFRCWHRGTREMDLILGRFADAEIASLRDDELAQLEHLIEVPDPDLYAALSGDVPLAPEYASDLFDRIKAFRSADHDA
jgi:antitoxin CptB